MKIRTNYSLLLKQIFLQVVLVAVLGLITAHAQYTITPATNFCMTFTPGGTSPSYTFTATGSHTQGTPVWSVRGELEIVSQTTTSAVIRATGYGKGRVVLTYNQGTGACSGGQQSAVDVYKIFTPPGSIVGPTCVRPGEPVTFSVSPVVSTGSQIGAEIGVDTYQWFINGQPVATSSWWVVPGTYTSGDGSSVTLVAPANLTGNPVLSVIIGACNAATPLSTTLSTKANVPVFSTNLAPTCLPVGSTTPFLVSVINEPGVTYTWSVTPGWVISGQTVVSGLNRVTVTPGVGAGEITVVAKANDASCESAVNRVTINRALSGANTISGGTGCLTVGSPVTFTLAGAPSGGTFQWQAPSGWSPATATGTSAVFTPSASAVVNGQISVRNTLCPDGVVTTTPVVANNQGLTFTLTDLGCGLYRVNAPTFVRTGATYQWFLNGVLVGTTVNNENNFTFDPWTGTRDVSVRVTKPSPTCLDAPASLTAQSYNCALLRTANDAAARESDGVSAYPNPTSDQFTLTLPDDETVKQISLEDQYGKVHKRFNTVRGTLVVDVSTLPQGLYIVTVKAGKQTITKKLKLER